MNDLTSVDLLRPHLHDPDVVITPDKYLAVAEGGRVTFRRDGSMKIEGAAMENINILEIYALHSSQDSNYVALDLTGIHGNRFASWYQAFWNSDYWSLPNGFMSRMMIVAICDFHGILHNWPRSLYWNEVIYQRVQAALKEKYKDHPLQPRQDGVSGRKAKAKDFRLVGCSSNIIIFFPLVFSFFFFICFAVIAGRLNICNNSILWSLSVGIAAQAIWTSLSRTRPIQVLLPLALMVFFAIFIISEPVRSGICKDNAFLALPIGIAAVSVGYRIGMAIIYLLLKSISELRGFLYNLFHLKTFARERSSPEIIPGNTSNPGTPAITKIPPPTEPAPQQPSSSPPAFDLPAWPDPDQSVSSPAAPKQYSAPPPANPPPPAPASAPPPVEQVRSQPISAPHTSDLPPGPTPPSSPPATSIPPPQPASVERFDLEPPLMPVAPMARMDERQQAILQEITEVAKLLDSAFNIPIINKSFGIDPLLGMIWGLGDAASFLPASYIIFRASTLGLPSYKLVRMLRNTLIDTGVGLIPIAGQATDFFIKANIANLNLIHDHFGLPPYKRPR